MKVLKAKMVVASSIFAVACALASGEAKALQVGTLSPSNCDTSIFTTAATGNQLGAIGAVTLTTAGAITNLTISTVYPYETGINGSTYVYTPAPVNVILSFTTSGNTVNILSPTFSSGSVSGYAGGSGTYTGSFTQNSIGGYSISVTVTISSGPLSGKTCSFNGGTFYVGS